MENYQQPEMRQTFVFNGIKSIKSIVTKKKKESNLLQVHSKSASQCKVLKK